MQKNVRIMGPEFGEQALEKDLVTPERINLLQVITNGSEKNAGEFHQNIVGRRREDLLGFFNQICISEKSLLALGGRDDKLNQQFEAEPADNHVFARVKFLDGFEETFSVRLEQLLRRKLDEMLKGLEDEVSDVASGSKRKLPSERLQSRRTPTTEALISGLSA